MKVKKNISLKPYNQFGVEAIAKYFAAPKTVEEVKEIITNPDLKKEKKIILGGGNNILFVNDFAGLVIRPEIMGREVIEKKEDKVIVKVGTGENWDEVVRWTVDQGWGGIENLVAIPGMTGGAVSQNIGAYGQEMAEVVAKIEAINLDTGEKMIFINQDCQFEYRSSIFKDKLRNKFLITYAYFKLTPEDADYQLNYGYASLKKELEKQVKPPYTLKQVMKAVANQRSNNLPDINRYGTCGCFFTNPLVSKEKFNSLQKKMPDLVCYPSEKGDNWVKLPAGKLVDERGWKGRWEDNVGVSKKHALCIVTKRQASGKEILELANRIRKDVAENYGVELEFEVNIVK
jgi:UDP-N-acetylmuramate dehydrogenase